MTKQQLTLTAYKKLITSTEEVPLAIVLAKPKDDIFLSGADALVNPVNCVGVMGAGLAAIFKKRYPNMHQDYVEVCAKKKLEPGKLHVFREDEFLTVVNFPTKIDYRDPSELAYVELGLEALFQWSDAVHKRIKSIAIPALGCGLGGLEWDDVQPLIMEYAEDFPCDVIIYPPR